MANLNAQSRATLAAATSIIEALAIMHGVQAPRVEIKPGYLKHAWACFRKPNVYKDSRTGYTWTVPAIPTITFCRSKQAHLEDTAIHEFQHFLDWKDGNERCTGDHNRHPSSFYLDVALLRAKFHGQKAVVWTPPSRPARTEAIAAVTAGKTIGHAWTMPSAPSRAARGWCGICGKGRSRHMS